MEAARNEDGLEGKGKNEKAKERERDGQRKSNLRCRQCTQEMSLQTIKCQCGCDMSGVEDADKVEPGNSGGEPLQ